MQGLKGYVVLYIASALVAAMAFTTLITHVNEAWFAPDLAIAVFVCIFAKYSQSRQRKRRD